MALTYSTLQTQIAGFLNRDDLTSQIPTFIDMAHGAINRDIRHWQMEKRSEATFNERYEPLPTDWLETKRVSISGKRQLDLLSQSQMLAYREANNNTSGEPRFYTHSSAQIELYPTPDGDYSATLIYMAEVPALSDSNTTNWLLTDHPDVYIYGSLKHSAPYLQEDARVQFWNALYDEAVRGINKQSVASMASGSGLAIR